MMIHQVLPITMAALAMLGTFLLGVGEGNMVLPILMVAVVITSVYFTDIKRVFRLNRNLANGAALIAASIALVQFVDQSQGSQLLAIANLLVYLQIVLLFQEKNVRVYGHLIMLSMLQAVVAAALDLSVWCGMLLIVYLALALVTLTLLFVYRETSRYLPKSTDSQPPARAATLHFTASEPEHVVQRVSVWGLPRMTASVVMTTLLVTVAVFYVTPRRGSPGETLVDRQSVVGFSETVRLGELDSIAQNPERVMSVQFLDSISGEPFRPQSGPLMRGSVVTQYDAENREWQQTGWRPSGAEPGLEHGEQFGLEAALRTGGVRQEILLEPLNQRVVFSVFPPLNMDDRRIQYDAKDQQIVRRGHARRQMQISLVTLGFQGTQQAAVSPQTEVLPSELGYGERQLRLYLEECRSIAPTDRSRFTGLAEAAEQALEQAGVPRLPDAGEGEPQYDPFLASRALEAYLRDSGRFVYSLAPPQRDPTIDPVEDFIVNNPSGHCEYFASAMTLMLRSVGISSRMVIGFRASEWNSLLEAYVVRQLHAHTWVEAYLPPEVITRHDLRMKQLPWVSEGGDSGSITRGGWLLLDPTATETDGAAITEVGLMARFREMASYMEVAWSNWVLGLDAERQQQAIYAPLVDAYRAIVGVTFGDEPPAAKLRRIARIVGSAFSGWMQGNWFSWRGGLVAMLLCLMLVGMYKSIRWIGRLLGRLLSRTGDRIAARAVVQVAFNRRMLRLLERHGLKRPAGQTPLEFAMAVSGQFAASPELRAAAPLPRQLVEAFYRVRYGGRPLDKQEAQAVEQALSELEAALTSRSRRPAAAR
ncbi:MAG: DUF3488 and transglutaminase-like domain-containing protein [Pirellulales bacterium]